MRPLRQPIFYLQWILITLSVIALLFLTIEGFKLPFKFSTKGFQNYLKLYEPYAILFAATFVVITSNLAIERLGLMSEANNNSFKASNRTLWIQTVREFFSEIKEQDPYLCKEVSRNIMNIHDYLFDKGYKLANKGETKDFFEKFFAKRVQFFEQMNTRYMNIACYGSDKQSYSWMNMRYLIFAMVNIDESYADFLKDLGDMYQQEVLKYSRPQIDKEMYELAEREHSMRKLRGTAAK